MILLSYILDDLGIEYDSLVTTVSAHDDSLTLGEVYSILLTFEARIQHHSQFIPTSPISANIAARQFAVFGTHGCGNFFDVRGKGCGSRNFSCGPIRGKFSSRNYDFWCQLCEKIGHTAS